MAWEGKGGGKMCGQCCAHARVCVVRCRGGLEQRCVCEKKRVGPVALKAPQAAR